MGLPRPLQILQVFTKYFTNARARAREGLKILVKSDSLKPNRLTTRFARGLTFNTGF